MGFACPDPSAVDATMRGSQPATALRPSNMGVRLMQALRIDENGPRIAPRARKTTKAPSASAKAKIAAAAKAERWAHWYTGTAVVLSSGLNGYAAVVESRQSGAAAVAAAGIGAIVPVLVWILGTVTAWTYRAGFRRLAIASGAVAACVLALSVVHVAAALVLLTGSSGLLASLLAIGIDVGLVSSEATAILVSSPE